MKFWNFKAKDKDTGELTLYGDIASSSWYGDEVTPTQFKKDLDSLGQIKNLDIYINSGGGDVFASQSIYSMLNRHEAFKTMYIDGLAASGASLIAMAGNKIVMPANALMMIHNSRTFAMGDKQKLREIADKMEKIDETLITVYQNKSKLEPDEIKQMLDDETWFTAEEAVEKGFADEIEQEKKLAASIDGSFLMLNNQKFDLGRYKNKPEVEEFEPEKPKEEPESNENRDESQPVSDNLKDQKDQFNKLTIKIHDYKEEN